MSIEEPTVPYGYCQCGCGQKTNTAPQNYPKRGLKAGDPYRYILGHGRRHGSCDYVVDDNGCWVWQRGLTRDGYAQRQTNGKRERVHRVNYVAAHGPIPDGLEIDHLCRNRACVNPEHLEPVTTAENVRRGANAKLTEADVRAIRTSSATGVELAAKYGVSATKISQIRLGRAWRGV